MKFITREPGKTIYHASFYWSILLSFALVIAFFMFAIPTYTVWSQEMSGRAEFAKAEQNRRIKIEEAKANLEAEKLNAQAEVERAKGAAEAIQIENGSLTPTYIQYLWVRQQNTATDKVIYIPTEANLPILEAKSQAQQYINEIIDDAKMTANKEAKKIVIQSIQRVATETAVENSVSVFHIDSDEVKGRVIGREGRNIRALEAATGTEIVVDDTPEAIVISAFDPVRREICRLALHQLVADGRIHPARIEEVVAKVKKQVEEEIIETGKRTTIDLGIHGLHPELIRIVGKMKYRSSYGQNLLQHARETANLCAVMAAEL